MHFPAGTGFPATSGRVHEFPCLKNLGDEKTKPATIAVQRGQAERDAISLKLLQGELEKGGMREGGGRELISTLPAGSQAAPV